MATKCCGKAETRSTCEQGAKYDDDKDRWDLVPLAPLKEVVRVLMHGARKYRPYGWTKVPNARKRFYAATQRHLISYQLGEEKDLDSGLHHLAHAACNILFMLWFEIQLQRKRGRRKK